MIPKAKQHAMPAKAIIPASTQYSTIKNPIESTKHPAMAHLRLKILISLVTLAIVALSGCVRHSPHQNPYQQSFLPQATFTGGTFGGGEMPVAASVPASVVTNCSTLMAAYLVAAGDDDPYERDGDLSVTQNGDGCSTVIGEPTPQ